MNTRQKLSWTLLGVALFFGIAAVSTDTSFFKNASLTGWLSLSGETNRLTVAGDALLLDGSAIGGGGGGESLWTTNSDGWITPAGGEYLTNTLVFTSGLADNATNVAAVVGTSSTWADDGSKILVIRNNGTNVALFSGRGGLSLGRSTPALGDATSIYSLRNLEDGDSGNEVFIESISDGDFTADALISLSTIAQSSTAASSAISIGATDADASPLWEIGAATATPAGANRIQYTSTSGATRVLITPEVADASNATAVFFDTQNTLSTTGAKILKASNAGTEKFSISHDGTPTVRTIPGITTTWTNMIDGVITQRITAVSGIIVTNLTL